MTDGITLNNQSVNVDTLYEQVTTHRQRAIALVEAVRAPVIARAACVQGGTRQYLVKVRSTGRVSVQSADRTPADLTALFTTAVSYRNAAEYIEEEIVAHVTDDESLARELNDATAIMGDDCWVPGMGPT